MVETRYWSHRTEFKKLRDRIKNGKSGEGSSQMTDLMKWKLRRWAFVSPYIQMKKATYSQELGRVSIAFDEFPSCMASFSYLPSSYLPYVQCNHTCVKWFCLRSPEMPSL